MNRMDSPSTPSGKQTQGSGVFRHLHEQPGSLVLKKDRTLESKPCCPSVPRRRKPSWSAPPQLLYSRKSTGNSAEFDNSFCSSKSSRSSEASIFSTHFKVLGNLGSGAFGVVYRVKSPVDGNRETAVKKSKEMYSNQADRAKQIREVERMVTIPCQRNLVVLERAWEELGYLYLQLELCRNSMAQELEDTQLTEVEGWNVLVDMLLALRHVHQHDIVHLDVKPDNIFISRDVPAIYKLGDFGIAVNIRDKGEVNEYPDGDRRYMAPEMMDGELSTKSDVFSLGLTMIEVACNADMPNGGEAYQQLRSGGDLPDPCNDLLPQSLVAVVKAMLAPTPAARPEVDQLLRIPVVKAEVKRRLMSLPSDLITEEEEQEYSLRLTESFCVPEVELSTQSFASGDESFAPARSSTPINVSTPVLGTGLMSAGSRGESLRKAVLRKSLGTPSVTKNLKSMFDASDDSTTD